MQHELLVNITTGLSFTNGLTISTFGGRAGWFVLFFGFLSYNYENHGIIIFLLDMTMSGFDSKI